MTQSLWSSPTNVKRFFKKWDEEKLQRHVHRYRAWCIFMHFHHNTVTQFHTNMKVAIGLRWKAGSHPAFAPSTCQLFAHPTWQSRIPQLQQTPHLGTGEFSVFFSVLMSDYTTLYNYRISFWVVLQSFASSARLPSYVFFSVSFTTMSWHLQTRHMFAISTAKTPLTSTLPPRSFQLQWLRHLPRTLRERATNRLRA